MRYYFENHGNAAEYVRILRTDFGRREAPSAPYVRYLVKKVQETGILIDKAKREKQKTVRTHENIAAVTESVCEASLTSITKNICSAISSQQISGRVDKSCREKDTQKICRSKSTLNCSYRHTDV